MGLVLSGGAEESLLTSLDFSLPPTTSYVQSRRLVSFFPSRASNFSPTGVRVARFNLNGQSWLDRASMRIYAKLSNTSATTTLQLADGTHCLIQRMRVYMSGTLIEDVDFYGRQHQLFRRLLMPTEWVKNDTVESGNGRNATFDLQPSTGSWEKLYVQPTAAARTPSVRRAIAIEIWRPQSGDHFRRRGFGRNARILHVLRDSGVLHQMCSFKAG